MSMSYIQLFLYTFLLAIIANYARFLGNDRFNKWILIITSLLLVEIHGFLTDFTYTQWVLLVFMGVSVICYQYFGAVMSAGIAWGILFIQTNDGGFISLVSYLLFSLVIALIDQYIRETKLEGQLRLIKLIHNSKQLNVFREVSASMQQTRHLQKLLQTILTSVTAGHGLGFNRAMILLIDEDGTKLNGIMGTGPMTAEEGFATWERITKKKYKLKDLLEIKETEIATDIDLNERVKKLEIPLDEPHFLYKTLESGNPLHIRGIDVNDRTLLLFSKQFNMSELAIIPLINQGVKVGVLIIDNPVNKKPITTSDIDSVIPLANQAAIAIQHTRLYTKIEDMALKDGLTGLFNQRALQSSLDQHFPKENQQPLSIVILDIDSFKQYNDTNGHLLGNEVLIQLSSIIQQTINSDQVAYRFGGEEFVILFPNARMEQANQMAEQVRINVENTPFPCAEMQPGGRITISLGVASTEGCSFSSPHELVDAADKALYFAKEKGKNKVVSYKGD